MTLVHDVSMSFDVMMSVFDIFCHRFWCQNCNSQLAHFLSSYLTRAVAGQRSSPELHFVNKT